MFNLQETPYGMPSPSAGADVPGLIVASSFGASLYFMSRKNVRLGTVLPFVVISVIWAFDLFFPDIWSLYNLILL